MKFFDKERHLRATSRFAVKPQEVWFPQLNRWVPVVNPPLVKPSCAEFSIFTIIGYAYLIIGYPFMALLGAIGAASAPMGSGAAVGGVMSLLDQKKKP